MLKRDNTRNRLFLPVFSILFLFICIGWGCKQPQAVTDPATQIQPQPEVQPEPQPTPKTFAVGTAFYNQDTGLLSIYTDAGNGVEFNLSILNYTLTSSSANNGKLTFDCLLVLQKEDVPDNTVFSINLTAAGYSSVYKDSFTYLKITEDTTTDSDRDGISDWLEINRYFTDPYSTDTDGDTWDDFEELSMYDPIRHIFDPRIADLPQMSIEISDDFSFSYDYTLSDSETHTSTETKSEGYTHTNSFNYTNATTSAHTHSWFLKGHLGGSVKDGFEGHSEFGVSGDYTSSSTYSFSRSFSETSSTTFSEGKADTKGETRNLKGGKVKTYITLKNTSNIAYTLDNIELTLNKLRFSDEYYTSFAPLGTYKHTGAITLAPNQSSRFIMEVELGVSGFQSIVNNASSLNVSVTGYHYTITRQVLKSGDFTEALTNVMAKCAFVRIDYGPELLSTGTVQPEEKYLISTKTRFNKNGTSLESLYDQISLYDALVDIVGFKEQTLILTENNKLQSIKGKSKKGSHADGDWYILKNYTLNGNEYSTMYNDYPIRNRGDESIQHTGNASYSFDEIVLEAGNEYHIFYSQDNDEDYVPLNEERQYNSDDTKYDSDGDIIDDFFEIYGWYRSMAPEKWFYTNPSNPDTDGDGDDDYNDDEPCIPKKSKESTICLCKIISATDDTEHDITDTVKAVQSNAEGAIVPTINVYDGIVLSIRTSVGYNKISYALTTQNIARSATSTLDGLSWNNMEPTTFIKNPVGVSYIWAKIVAYDNSVTDYVPIAKISSNFCKFKNFSLSAMTLGGTDPAVGFTFDSYSDTRSDNKNTGGYIVYGTNNFSNYQQKTSISRSEVTGAQTTISSFENLTEFYYKVENLKNSFTLKPFKQGEKWYFSIFAYSGINSEETFRNGLLTEISANGGVTTTKRPNGKLIFYPIWFRADKDQDGGSDPEYYWTFSSNDGGKMNFSTLNKPEAARVKMDDDSEENKKYYIFDEGNGTLSGTEPSGTPFTAKASAEYDRQNSHSVTIMMSVWEYDSGSSNDYVGSMEFRLEYDPSKDRWTGSDGSEYKDFLTGQRIQLKKSIKNEEEGEVSFKCAFEWANVE